MCCFAFKTRLLADCSNVNFSDLTTCKEKILNYSNFVHQKCSKMEFSNANPLEK